jgi:hypothetical protein
MGMELTSSVTEERIGFPTLVDAQVFWATLEDPREYHIVRIVQHQLYGSVLAYLVERNED